MIYCVYTSIQAHPILYVLQPINMSQARSIDGYYKLFNLLCVITYRHVISLINWRTTYEVILQVVYFHQYTVPVFLLNNSTLVQTIASFIPHSLSAEVYFCSFTCANTVTACIYIILQSHSLLSARAMHLVAVFVEAESKADIMVSKTL